MTTELLQRSSGQLTQGEQALAIIDAYRDEFADRTTLSQLDMEFPYLEIEGKESMYLLETGDNLAGTFKWRGALVGAVALQRAGFNRLVAPSAGNHALGSILSAKVLEMWVDTIAPWTAPYPKREGLKLRWTDPRNRVHTHGNTFDESLAYALEYIQVHGGGLLHPYDDKNVIGGQGTIVDDLLREAGDISQIVVPVGGGGLTAGILNRLKELGREDIDVTGVEAPGSNSLSRSLIEKRIVKAEAPNQAYGGSAVNFASQLALRAAMDSKNFHIVTADTSDIEYVTATYQHARQDLMRANEYFVPAFEPTSLVAVAGLYKAKRHTDGKTVVIGTGHNAPLPRV